MGRKRATCGIGPGGSGCLAWQLLRHAFMRLAVFTNQFPGRITTFFARDMRGLQQAGVEIDVFPIYPLDASLWSYVPDILSDEVLPRDRVRHIGFFESVQRLGPGG